MNQADRFAAAPDALAFLAGGGDTGALIRAFDWASTALGPAHAWPQSLRSALSIGLNSSFPIALYWGSDLVLLYNDEWSPILGHKHPWALGRPAREAWPEIWHIIEPLFQQVLTTGEPIRQRDQLLPMQRRGFTEECYFDYTFSPVRGEGGGVEGVFNAVVETTLRVVGERRLRTLRTLTAWEAGVVRSAEDACRTAASTLSENPHDLPFMLLYLLDDDGRRASLAGRAGLGPDSPVSPACIHLDAADAPWPLRRVVESGHAVDVDLPDSLGPLSGAAWPEPPQRAVVLPLAKPGKAEPAGFVVAGVSPRLPLDDEHRGFLDLLAGHVATAVANARAYQAEQQRAEALAEIDRAKTAFFSNVSHEFRTPLTLMLGPVEELLARERAELPPAAAEQLEVVNRNGMRLLRLVNTLLDFSRIEAGRAQARFQPTDLATFTADLASNFRSACERAGLRLLVDCAPLGQPAFVDRGMWEKVVLNLLSNAFKFTFAGEIAVSLRRAGQAAELRVRDTGTGIPAAEMPRLFERFHRVENARGRTHEGSGIGLALVQELAKLHGGSISATSVVDEGTEFVVAVPLGVAHLRPEQIDDGRSRDATTSAAGPYVEEALRWLPDADRADVPSATAPDRRPGGDGSHRRPGVDRSDPQPGTDRTDRPRVLVADDNADMRQYVVRLLAGQFEVEAVADGEAALAAARARPPALVLSDVMMPRLDGFGLLRELRAEPRTRDIPVILLSARAGEESRVEGVQAGADDYLVKPFSASELLARVSAHLQIARLRREAGEAVRGSEELYRALMTASAQIIWTTDAEGRVADDSPTWRAFTGQTLDQWRGWGWLDAIHTDDREATAATWQRCLRDKCVCETEYRLRRHDGEYRWTAVRAVPVLSPQGSVRLWVGMNTDITERRRAEASTRHGRQQLAFALDAARLGQWELNLVDHTASRTLRHDQIFGYDALLPEWTYEMFLEHVVPDDRASVDAAFQAAVASGTAWDIECRIRRADGVERWIWTRALIQLDGQGQVEWMLGIVGDQTERKRAESLQAGQKHVLEKVAAGEALPDVLQAVCRLVQQQEPGVICSLLLPGEPGQHPGLAVGPSLPATFLRGLQGLRTHAPYAGSCWQPLHCAQVVVVPDVAANETFAPEWRALLGGHGLRASRSIPVFGESGTVLASLAIYHREPCDRAPDEELVSAATHLAAIAIERARAERQVVRSEERFRTLVTATSQVVWGSTPEGEVNEASPTWIEYTGQMNGEWRGWGWIEAVHPDDREPTATAWRDALAARTLVDVDYRLRRHDGEYRWATVRGAPLLDADGRVREWIGTITDIHERRTAEARLRLLYAVSEATREAIDPIAVMAATTRLLGEHLVVTRCAYADVEADNDRVTVRHDWTVPGAASVVGEYSLDQFGSRTAAELRGGRTLVVRDVDREMTQADGARMFDALGIKAVVACPLVKAGRLVALMAVHQSAPRNWTAHEVALVEQVVERCWAHIERVRAAEALREADRRKDAFLATLAHELRNPLAPIRTGLQVMKMSGDDGEASERSRHMMERQVEHMVRLVDDLMDVSRITRDKVELRRERVQLTAVLGKAVETSRPLLDGMGHTVTLTLPAHPVVVDADPTRLAQVFANLLNNAAKYSERNGHVRLSVEREGGDAVVAVQDSGIGIAADQLHRIFEMFTQVDQSLEKTQGGLGIGLTLVKRLVEMHGGRVEAQSEGPGRGSRFVVRLPVVVQAPVPAHAGKQEPPAATSSLRILVVDDNRDGADSLAEMLNIFGHDIRTAYDGEAAVAAAREFRPDVILLDLGLPKLNGYEACRRIRAQQNGTPAVVIAQTGWGSDEDRQRTTAAGFDHHMVKPVDPSALLELLAGMSAVPT